MPFSLGSCDRNEENHLLFSFSVIVQRTLDISNRLCLSLTELLTGVLLFIVVVEDVVFQFLICNSIESSTYLVFR